MKTNTIILRIVKTNKLTTYNMLHMPSRDTPRALKLPKA